MFNLAVARTVEFNFPVHFVDDLLVPNIKTAILERRPYLVYSMPSAYVWETCDRNGNLGRVIIGLEIRDFKVAVFRNLKYGGVRLLISGWSTKDFHEKGHLNE